MITMHPQIHAGEDPSGLSFGLSGAPAAESSPGDPLFVEASGEQRFELGGTIGRGGMGRVRLATDRVLGREVAVKELEPSLHGDPGAALRMVREARLTALLDHPGIVAVHDAGLLRDGRPFYAMRLIRGRSLAAALAEARDEPARLVLLRQLLAVCEAVAVAHAAGVVHRDLKPANLLLGAFGEAQVIDWGLAALTPRALARWPALAHLGGPQDLGAGTPAWMAPEQAAGAPPEPTADVWSLGAVLGAVLAGHGSPELTAVVGRAMDPDPRRRYPDAGALATELLRWFEGRRVEAHSYSPLELLRRLVRAWRVPIVVGLAGLVALAASIVVGVWQAGVERDMAREAERRAVTSQRDAERALARSWVRQAEDAVLTGMRARAEQDAARALRLRDSPEARGVLAAFGRQARPRLLARTRGPDCEWKDLSADGAVLLCGEKSGDVSAWTGALLRETWRSPLRATGGVALVDGGARVWNGWNDVWMLGQDGEVAAAHPTGAWSTDGPWVPLFGPIVTFIADAPWPGARFDLPSPCTNPNPRVILPAPGDDRVLTACGDGVLRVGPPDDPLQRSVPTRFHGEVEVTAAAWVPGEAQVLLGTLRDEVALVDLTTGAVLATVDTDLGLLARLAVAPDGQTVAISGSEEGVGVWDFRRGLWHGTLPARRGAALAWAGESLRVFDGEASTWHLPPASAPPQILLGAGLADAKPSPDDRALALATGSGEVVHVDLATGRRETVAALVGGVAKSVAWRGETLALTGVGQPFLALWRAGGPLQSTSAIEPGRRVVWLGDGALASVQLYGGLEVRIEPSGAAPPETHLRGHVIDDLEATPDGGALLLERDDTLWRLGPDAGLTRVGAHPGAVAVAGAGDLLALARDGEVELVGPAAHRVLSAPGAGLRDVAVAADSSLVAAGGLDARLRVWDAATGELLLSSEAHTERISAVAFSRRGDWLVTASWDHSARLWDLHPARADRLALADEVAAAWGGLDLNEETP